MFSCLCEKIVMHANHYKFGVIFTLFKSNYTITVVIAILRFLLHFAEPTQSTIYECPH